MMSTPEIKSPPPKPIGFQFDVKQWLGDQHVMKMSYAERGMHLHLMCVAWQETPPCTLPNDDVLLARWLGIAEKAWINIHKRNVLGAWKQVIDTDPPEHVGRWVLEGLQRSYLKQVTALAARRKTPETPPPSAKPPLSPEDERKALIWRIGIELLAPEHPSPTARQLIGKAIKKYGEPTVAEVLGKASILQAFLQSADRWTYLQGMLSQHARKDVQKEQSLRRGDLVL